MTQLEVQLTADIKRLKAQLNVANRELRRFGTQADKQGAAANRGFQRAGKGAANATPTLLEFNRVVQDAPFGIQGVANNIQQLTGNFQALTKQAGGTGAAIKLLLKEFIGPAGILFAVSAITSLLVTYGDRLFTTSSKTKELTDATKSFAGSARAEISVLQTLLGIASDETQSRERRNEAVQVLQNKYPNYLKNLNKENTTTKNIKKAVDDLTKAIENRAKVQGAEALIQQKAEELFLKQEKAQQAYKTAIDNIPKSLENARQANNAYARGIGATQQQIFDQQKNEERQRDIANQRLSQSLGEAEKEYQEYVNNLKNILSGVPSIFDAFGGDSGSGGEAQRKSRNIYEQFLQGGGVFSGTPEIVNVVQDVTNQIANTVGELPNKIRPDLSEVEFLWANTALRINQIGQESFAQGISFAFDDVGRALADGGNVISALGSSIIGAFGNFLSQFGQQLIAYGVAALAFSKVSKGLLNPITAGPSAAAAIAIGAALSAAGGALSSISSRGLGGGAGSNVAGQGLPSRGFSQSVGSASNGFGDGTVVFEIQGQSLVGVLQRTLGKNARLGGNLTIG